MKFLFGFTPIAILLMFNFTYSQQKTLEGKIVDKESGEPLIYVNIGIPEQHTGTVSNRSGDYEIKLPLNILETDTVVFSFVGYKTIRRPIANLQKKDQKIQMEVEENQLNEVVLETKKLKHKKLGRTNKGLGLMHWNFYSAKEKDVDDRLSKELGMNFKLHKNCRLEKFNFAITTNEFKSLKFRINIYSLTNDQPDSLLISQNIIFELSNEITGWQTIDLSPYNLYLEEHIGEFLLTIQWVESKKENEKSKYFAIPASKSPFHKIYFRDKAMDKWISQTGSLSMYLDAKCSN